MHRFEAAKRRSGRERKKQTHYHASIQSINQSISVEIIPSNKYNNSRYSSGTFFKESAQNTCGPALFVGGLVRYFRVLPFLFVSFFGYIALSLTIFP